MNKDYQFQQLRRILENPKQQSCLYLIDTDLSDDDIETFIKGSNLCHYIKEKLIPTAEGNAFELFLVGLSHKCNDSSINSLRDHFLVADERNRDTIIYSLLIQIMKHLCFGKKSVIHLHGIIDLTSFYTGDLCKLDAALTHLDETVLVISKLKRNVMPNVDTFIQSKTLNYIIMKNKLNKVHISYKHDDAYEDALNAIIAGLNRNKIPYSIDNCDILYLDNIDDYEKEIGHSDKVIMFVIPNYFKSLDCMYEMTQIFMNGNVRDRIIPVVDMGEIPRNSDGLTNIKNYWKNEKSNKIKLFQTNTERSSFLRDEIGKIENILYILDDLWNFICRNSTGDFQKLIDNEAALLMDELKKTLPTDAAPIDEKFVPSRDTIPATSREVSQNGDKSIYIENNTGSININ